MLVSTVLTLDHEGFHFLAFDACGRTIFGLVGHVTVEK